MYTYHATLVRVLDGDTLECVLDLGLHLSYKAKIRLAEVNAPELNTLEGIEAKEYVMTLCSTGQLIIQTKSGQFDKYGRVLGSVVSMPEGTNIGVALLEKGLATKA